MGVSGLCLADSRNPTQGPQSPRSTQHHSGSHSFPRHPQAGSFRERAPGPSELRYRVGSGRPQPPLRPAPARRGAAAASSPRPPAPRVRSCPTHPLRAGRRRAGSRVPRRPLAARRGVAAARLAGPRMRPRARGRAAPTTPSPTARASSQGPRTSPRRGLPGLRAPRAARHRATAAGCPTATTRGTARRGRAQPAGARTTRTARARTTGAKPPRLPAAPAQCGRIANDKNNNVFKTENRGEKQK